MNKFGFSYNDIENVRLLIKVWYHGKVTTIKEMEHNLIEEYLDTIYPLTSNKKENLRMLCKRLQHNLNYEWRSEYLTSLNPDRYYRDRRVDE